MARKRITVQTVNAMKALHEHHTVISLSNGLSAEQHAWNFLQAKKEFLSIVQEQVKPETNIYRMVSQGCIVMDASFLSNLQVPAPVLLC